MLFEEFHIEKGRFHGRKFSFLPFWCKHRLNRFHDKSSSIGGFTSEHKQLINGELFYECHALVAYNTDIDTFLTEINTFLESIKDSIHCE